MRQALLTTEQSPRDRVVRACNCLIATFFDCQRYRLNSGKWAAQVAVHLKQPLLPGVDPNHEAIKILTSFRQKVGLKPIEDVATVEATSVQLMAIYTSLRTAIAIEIENRDSRRKAWLAREAKQQEKRAKHGSQNFLAVKKTESITEGNGYADN